jgi:hypothetical protein
MRFFDDSLKLVGSGCPRVHAEHEIISKYVYVLRLQLEINEIPPKRSVLVEISCKKLNKCIRSQNASFLCYKLIIHLSIILNHNYT